MASDEEVKNKVAIQEIGDSMRKYGIYLIMQITFLIIFLIFLIVRLESAAQRAQSVGSFVNTLNSVFLQFMVALFLVTIVEIYFVLQLASNVQRISLTGSQGMLNNTNMFLRIYVALNVVSMIQVFISFRSFLDAVSDNIYGSAEQLEGAINQVEQQDLFGVMIGILISISRFAAMYYLYKVIESLNTRSANLLLKEILPKVKYVVYGSGSMAVADILEPMLEGLSSFIGLLGSILLFYGLISGGGSLQKVRVHHRSEQDRYHREVERLDKGNEVCLSCGTENRGGSKFCMSCGASMVENF